MTKLLSQIEGLNLSGGGTLRICGYCRLPFVAYPRPGVPEPTHCPKCLDQRQQRPSLCVERRCLEEFDGVEIESLPGDWQEFTAQAHDYPCYKIDVAGSQYGAQWQGRIVIYAGRPYKPGDVVKLRVMEAVHKVKVTLQQRQRSDFKAGTVVAYSVRRVVPLSSEEGEETLETRPYIALEPSSAQSTRRLVWATAYTKTTLKGYGRQIHARLAGLPLWSRQVRGGVRSGRAHTVGAIAIVDNEHPLEVVHGNQDEGTSR